MAEEKIQVVGHWSCGPSFDVVVSGNIRYDGVGGAVWISDITDRENPVKIGEIYTEYLVRGLYKSGNFLYIASEQDFIIADVSNPSNPVISGHWPIQSGYPYPTRYYDVVIQGEYAYIAAYEYGLLILNVSDPSNITEVGHLDVGSNAWRIEVDVDHAYIVHDSTSLSIINISNPTAPIEEGKWTYTGGIGGLSHIAISGDYVYVIGYGFGVFSLDISDKANPIECDSIIDESNFRASGIKIIGNYAYISTRYGGLRIMDIHDPSNMSTLGINNDFSGYAEGISVTEDGHYAYVANHYRGIGIFDVSIVSNPILVNESDDLSRFSRSYDVIKRGDYAYVSDDEGLLIIDVLNPSNPTLVGRALCQGRSWDIDLQGDYAYVASTWAGLRIVDISNPTNPQLVSSLYPNNYGVNAVRAKDNYAYIGAYSQGGGFAIADISDPNNPSIVSMMDYTVDGYAVDIKENYVLLGMAGAGLKIINVSDSRNPIEVASLGGYVTAIKVFGDYAVVNMNGTSILDISDPTNPVVIWSNSDLGAYDYDVFGSALYIAKSYGVEGYDISDPNTPTYLASYTLPENVDGISYDDPYIYASNYHIGFYVLKYIAEPDITPPEITNINATPQTYSAIITWDTNEIADSLVKYGTSLGSYDKQVYSPSFTISHSIILSGLEQNKTYYFVVNSTDLSSNTNQSIEYSFMTPADVTSPVITIVNPANNTEFIGGTESVNIIITTDEPAWCQYSTSDFIYGDGTNFTTGEGTTQHSFVLNLKDGESYTFYYRCTDSTGNKNTVSTIHTFTTATKWWDYFDDETKILENNNLEISDGEAKIKYDTMQIGLDKDACLQSSAPNNNFGSGHLALGFIFRSVIEFTMPSGKGNIASAKLYLYKSTTLWGEYNETYNLHKLNGTFVENEVTWNNRDANTPWLNPGGDYDPTIISHYGASGNINEWHVWTIKGTDADNSLDSLTWGDTMAFLIKGIGNDRYDYYYSKESENNPYIEIGIASLSGDITSTAITPTSIISWDKFNANYSTPAGTNITFSILNAETDEVLCSELTGKGDDISNCLIGVDSIKLKAELTTTDPSNTPVLYDWEINWITSECPQPISLFTHNAQSCI